MTIITRKEELRSLRSTLKFRKGLASPNWLFCDEKTGKHISLNGGKVTEQSDEYIRIYESDWHAARVAALRHGVGKYKSYARKEHGFFVRWITIRKMKMEELPFWEDNLKHFEYSPKWGSIPVLHETATGWSRIVRPTWM